jgi:hypothetical protein
MLGADEGEVNQDGGRLWRREKRLRPRESTDFDFRPGPGLCVRARACVRASEACEGTPDDSPSKTKKMWTEPREVEI